jgi:HEAT repeat protein
MGSHKITSVLTLLIACCTLKLEAVNLDHAVYLMQSGECEKAFQAYQEHYNQTGTHDFELIERLGLILLDQGFRTRDPETQLLTLYGAGISLDEKALYIIENSLTSPQPELQLIALNFIERLHHDRTDQLLHRAMASDQLLIRLEAALQLAAKRDPKAIGQIEALMAKVPAELWMLFPPLLALIDNRESKILLRKLLAHPKEAVRVSAIMSIAQNGHDDFLPVIRRLASHHEIAQQEACAAALGMLRDEGSLPRLKQLSASANSHVRLAALQARYQIGQEEVRQEIENLALKPDLYAIQLLGEISGSEPALLQLLKSADRHVRLNAALSLLNLGHPHCCGVLAAVLLKDKRDMAILKGASPGKSLSAWKIIPSAAHNLEDNPTAQELCLDTREALLVKAGQLPERDFLRLAEMLLEQQQNDLVPVLMRVLEEHPTAEALALLKKYHQKAGAPLVRNYANLALYRLKQPGPYADNLRKWVIAQRAVDLIRFRPLVTWDARENGSASFELTPQETSRLLLEAFEAFVSTQDDKGIDILISMIQTGNPKNKYALIGLLMRAIQ